MAPRRGGGGGGIRTGGSSASCPGAFQGYNSVTIPYFVCWCIMFLVAVGTLYAMSSIKKKYPHAKRLLGWLYGTTLLFYVIVYALRIIGTILQECDTTSMRSYYNFVIAWSIFFLLANFMLLCIVLHGVNTALRNMLGHNPKFLSIIYGVVLAFMFILNAAYIGLSSYNIWAIYGGSRIRARFRIQQANQLAVAYYVFYLLIVFLATAGMIVSIVQMRSRRMVTGSLTGGIIVLAFSMIIWVIFILAQVAASLSRVLLQREVNTAFHWIELGFQAIAMIAILFIAKSRALAQAPDSHGQPVMYQNPGYPNGGAPAQPVYNPVTVPAPQQQYNTYAYNGGNGTQTTYQQPVYNQMPNK
ncbi:hypothetical protein K469DRAFT_743704 [Zopfia rhizophila CBS 207.26]|uniref:Uncharacterized protein n=1 Tax=Zopfia rhizophila CBS 207.26 TaxID=1314779 RepID=A0A6A6EVH2_9PEZI|nr:hypothetical protein K469DRAFT_743704 [Zopfia rhizophila CBS 207.26]